jgi:hypothetical protein
MQQRSFFPHESLRAYKHAVAVSRWVSGTKFPVGMAWLRDQTQRAAGSVVLNIAEGQTVRWTVCGRGSLRQQRSPEASRAPDRSHRQGPPQPPYGPSPAARAFAASGSARWSQIAYASAAEACAALDLLDLPGATEQQQALRGIGAMLAGLMR